MLRDLCFEIIQKCPNNCLFCSSCSSIDKDKMISLDIFKKTIDHFIKLGGIEEISISGGEPLLHPDLYEMIKYCKDNNIRTVLFTSGIKRRIKVLDSEIISLEDKIRKNYFHYINEGLEIERYEKIVKKEIDIVKYYNNQDFCEMSKEEANCLKYLGLDKIVFDFQSWDNKIYDNIMGTTDYMDYVKSSILKASIAGLETDAHFIPTKLNYKEIPDIIEMLNVTGFSSLSILNFVPQGRGETNLDILMLNDNEMEEFKNILNENQNRFNGLIRIGIPLINNDAHLCTAGFSKLVIKYDGTVLPCPAFKECDLKKLKEMGISLPNIYSDLETINVHNGSRAKPLCKEFYKFSSSIK